MKYNKSKYFFWIVCLGIILNIYNCQIDPCGSAPADLIENLEDLVKEVKQVDYKPKDERWSSYDEQFKTYFEDCYDRWSPDMTGNQKRKFTGLVARYMANRFGRSFFRSVFGDENIDQKESSEFFEKLGQDLDKFLEKNKESGQQFFEDLMNDVRSGINRDSNTK